MVIGQLEILRALVDQRPGQFVPVVVRPFAVPAVERKVVVDAVILALDAYFPVIVILVRGGELHLQRGEDYRRHAAGGVAVGERHALKIALRAAEAVDDALFVEAVAVLAHRPVVYRGAVHPFTPPAVRPEVMCFWQRKKIIRTGSETVMLAAAKTGQLPLISVAWRA